MKKEIYCFLYDDGLISKSDKKLTEIEAVEMAEEFGAGIVLPASKIIKLYKFITK